MDNLELRFSRSILSRQAQRARRRRRASCGASPPRRRFVCAFKAQLCGIRFPLEANRDLGQQVYTIRMHNAQAAHVNCPLRPPARHEVHLHQIGVIKFTYPGGACELSDSSFRFPPLAVRGSRCYGNHSPVIGYDN